MGLFDRWTKKSNPYEAFDKSNHLKPRINKAEFCQLTGFDFGWHLLEPISIAESLDDLSNSTLTEKPRRRSLASAHRCCAHKGLAPFG